MPQEVHDCVKELLAKEDFYPDDPERESIAWGICNKRLESSAISITATDAIGQQIELVGSEDGDILLFSGAIMCHVGVNSNGDGIPNEAEIDNLANTIVGRAIDIEHKEHIIHGVFTSGRRVVGKSNAPALEVGGLIWADRFPDSASDVKSGVYKLSIEAEADMAECSLCGKQFYKAGEYCDHLFNRSRSGAVRYLHGLKAKGGALTRNPADSGADFSGARLRMVASHDDGAVNGGSNSTEDLSMGEAEKIAELEASVKELEQKKSELEAAVDGLNQKLASMDGDAKSLTDELNATKASLEESQGRCTKLLEDSRRGRMAATIDDSAWSEKREVIMQMSDEAFELMASVAKGAATEPRRELGIGVEGSDDGHDEPSEGWEF